MGRVVQIPTTRAQQALARFHAEEEAFRAVLDVLVEFRSANELVVGVYSVYRARLRMLRRLAGGLLDCVEQPRPAEELREYTRKRDVPRKRDR
jgi:hypothetical protein